MTTECVTCNETLGHKLVRKYLRADFHRHETVSISGFADGGSAFSQTLFTYAHESVWQKRFDRWWNIFTVLLFIPAGVAFIAVVSPTVVDGAHIVFRLVCAVLGTWCLMLALFQLSGYRAMHRNRLAH